MREKKRKSVKKVSKVGANGSLISAVSEGDLVSVKKLVHSHSLSYCECGNGGYGLLFIAIKLGHTDIAKFLLQEGAKADCEADNVVTPLHLATGQGYTELVQLLLEKHAPVDPQNTQNETPLHFAAKKGYEEIVQVLLNKNASVIAQTNEGSTPFHFAMEGRHEKVFGMLLEHAQANLTASAKTRNSTLLSRILLCNPTICEKVSRLVAEIVTLDDGQSKIVDELINQGFVLSREHVNESLLLAAVKKNYIKFIDSIMRNAANRNDAKHYPQLLHTAVKNGHKEIVELFLNSGFSANAKDAENKTCLCYSLDCDKDDKYVEIIQLLFANGADVKEAPELLLTAVREGLIEVCKLLIANGANVNVSKSGETPLYLAVAKNKKNSAQSRKQEGRKQIDETTRNHIVKLLLHNGADVSINIRKYTAFHHAILSGRKEAVSIFLEYGVDADLRAANDSTPLFLAAKRGHAEIVEILCQHNADVNARRGKTSPLFRAVLSRKAKVVETLLKFGADVNFGIDDALDESDDEDYGDDHYYMDVMLKKHTIKLKAAGFDVRERNLGYRAHSGFLQSCEEEVSRLKKEMLNPDFSLYDVLASGKRPTYAKNKTLMRKLKSFNLDPFPIYKNLITSNVERCRFRLELQQSGQHWVDFLVKTSCKLNGGKYSVLPVEILEHIVSYLTNSEIKNLISCGEGLKRQLSH